MWPIATDGVAWSVCLCPSMQWRRQDSTEEDARKYWDLNPASIASEKKSNIGRISLFIDFK